MPFAGFGLALALAVLCSGCSRAAPEQSEPTPAANQPSSAERCRAGELAECVTLSGGDPKGCIERGLQYESGRGVPRDGALAARLYEAACERGVMQGCTNLGGLLTDGAEGVPSNPPRAKSLLERACSAREAVGCANLGVLYERGVGVAADAARAAELYRSACDGESARGCVNFANMLDRGNGVAQDSARAHSLWEKACERREGQGCHNAGNKYLRGIGVTRDPSKAMARFERGCGRGSSAPREVPLATELAKKACGLGNSAACARASALSP
jgi:uncharacterized protein